MEISSAGGNDVEIKSRIACPDFAIITVIGKAHLQGFGDIEGVKAVKRKLFDVCMERNGTLVVNHDHPTIVELAGAYPKVLRYGTGDECDISGEPVPGKVPLELNWKERGGASRRTPTKIFGGFNAPNLLAAATVANATGVPHAKLDAAIRAYTPGNMRSQLLDFGDVRVILDTYNSNPTSLGAVLTDFLTSFDGHRTVILGDMLELGAHSEAEHMSVLDLLNRAEINSVYLVGSEFGRVIGNRVNASWFPNVDDLLLKLRQERMEATSVLIKGSRGMKLERLLAIWD